MAFFYALFFQLSRECIAKNKPGCIKYLAASTGHFTFTPLPRRFEFAVPAISPQGPRSVLQPWIRQGRSRTSCHAQAASNGLYPRALAGSVRQL